MDSNVGEEVDKNASFHSEMSATSSFTSIDVKIVEIKVEPVAPKPVEEEKKRNHLGESREKLDHVIAPVKR